MKQIAVTLFLALCTVLPFSLFVHAIDKNIWTDSDGLVLEYSPRPIVSSDTQPLDEPFNPDEQLLTDAINPENTDELGSTDDLDTMDEMDRTERVEEPLDVNEDENEDHIDSSTYSISPDVAQIPVDIENTTDEILPLDTTYEGEGADGNERDEIENQPVEIDTREEHVTDPADDIDDTLE